MLKLHICRILILFFFNDTATTEIYTLSLHDALPIYQEVVLRDRHRDAADVGFLERVVAHDGRRDLPRDRDHRNGVDRKSTRLNSSHANISYAVFCLKKKKKTSSMFYSAHFYMSITMF